MKTSTPRTDLTTIAWAWGPFAAWAGTIFWLSTRPGEDISPYMPALEHSDKLVHALAFGAGAWLARRALRIHPRLAPDRATGWAILLVTLYGVLDELHQHLGDAGREADVLDVVADATGASVAAFLHALLERLQPTRQPP